MSRINVHLGQAEVHILIGEHVLTCREHDTPGTPAFYISTNDLGFPIREKDLEAIINRYIKEEYDA